MSLAQVTASQARAELGLAGIDPARGAAVLGGRDARPTLPSEDAPAFGQATPK